MPTYADYMTQDQKHLMKIQDDYEQKLRLWKQKYREIAQRYIDTEAAFRELKAEKVLTIPSFITRVNALLKRKGVKYRLVKTNNRQQLVADFAELLWHIADDYTPEDS